MCGLIQNELVHVVRSQGNSYAGGKRMAGGSTSKGTSEIPAVFYFLISMMFILHKFTQMIHL